MIKERIWEHFFAVDVIILISEFQNERVEFSTPNIGLMARQQTEALISLAVTNGDKHEHTWQMANWWLREKSAVHKLFKVKSLTP